MNRRLLFPLLVLAIATLACGESAPKAPAYTPIPEGNTLPAGERILGIDITTPEKDDYDAAIAQAKSAGAQAVSLSVYWDDIETAPGEFAPAPNWLQIANIYYPEQGLRLMLTISVLDTTADRRTEDLRPLPFDDPQVIARFKSLLDYVASQTSDLNLVALSIGNEVDGVLGADETAWAEYADFFEKSAAHARSLWPGLPIGVKMTYDGASRQRHLAALLWEASDAVLLTYYPLNQDFTVRPPETVGADFASMLDLAGDKPLYLPEVGYPSSETCSSSPEQQAAFIWEVFQAWDAHAENIPLVTFVWLTDLPPASVKELQHYYGLRNKAFGEYLRTLGLRTWEGAGQDKPAFLQLRAEARARGWATDTSSFAPAIQPRHQFAP